MEKQEAVEKLYGIKGAIDYFPRFKGQAKIINQILNMIHFINNHMPDAELNKRFVEQGDHLLNRASAIVDRMNNESEQQQQAMTF